MDKALKCIITGVDKNGQSCFEYDAVPEVTFTHSDWPGYNNIELWQTTNNPPQISDKYMARPNYDFDIPPGIARFVTMRLPPLKKLIAHQEKLGNQVDLKTFGMHKTNTVDYLTLLEGEATLILETGEERTLKPGDCVVQKGNLHAWHNRGETDCIFSCVLIGAEV